MTRREMVKGVYQILPNMSYGDAITNHVLVIKDILKELGYNSGIFSVNQDPRLSDLAQSYKDYRPLSSEDNLVIYHFSIGSEITDFFKTLPDKKMIVYHNITPSHFFLGINRMAEVDCRRGREELKSLIPFVEIALGVSEFNRLELEEAGFKITGVLPVVLNDYFYSRMPNRRLLKLFNDGKVNLLHVGRIAPNKKIEDVIKVFYFYNHKINPASRLLIVGSDVNMENYAFGLKELSDGFGLGEVYFIGAASIEELNACYRVAHAYICMSEHEGFCVPLLEAMFFGVPIIAYNSSGIPYTLGDAGILVNEKNFEEIAEMMDILVRDKRVRDRVVECQRKRLKDFSMERLKDSLKEYLNKFKI
ncbi:MAG: glycosyltransferase family 4 protein [Nitrospirae bacterium]|nr:glycosyltransferase family 4 protein [Nitrospirota bacterium]